MKFRITFNNSDTVSIQADEMVQELGYAVFRNGPKVLAIVPLCELRCALAEEVLVR